jgi:hypothetical protein
MLLETMRMNDIETVSRIERVRVGQRRWLPLVLVVALAALTLAWLANGVTNRVERGEANADAPQVPAAAALPVTQTVTTTIHLPLMTVAEHTLVASPPEECLTYDGPGGYDGTVFAREHCVLETGTTYRIETADHKILYFAAEIKNGAGMTIYINNYGSRNDRVIVAPYGVNRLGQCIPAPPKFGSEGESIIYHFDPSIHPNYYPTGTFCLALENFTKPESSPMAYDLTILDGPPQ